MAEVPILKDEIDRKAFATVESLYNGLDNGKLTVPQFSTGLDTLFSAVSGLVDPGVIDLISAASQFVERHKGRMVDKRVFSSPRGAIVVLTRKLGTDTFTLETYAEGKRQQEKVRECMLAKEASDAMEWTAKGLLDKGWIEL